MASVKKNFAYNIILTVSGYIFPLLTYPYISRVLGVDNLGTCNFVGSLIDYFILFSNLGIGSYGVREIARYSNNQNKKNEIFTNLFVINVVTTIISLIILCVLTNTVASLQKHKSLLLVGSLQLVFNLFLTNWFFQGISDFKYVTYRSLFVKILYVVLIFIFIRNQDDTLLYYFLTVTTIVLNAIINWMYGRKYRKLDFKLLHIRYYITPVITFGFYLIVTSMYTSFNTVFLGFVTNTKEVGYFTTATKLYTIIMGLFSAFTTVMVPRVAKLLKENDYNHLQVIASDTFSLIIIFAMPLIAFCELNASDIILILSGKGYEGAILPFRIVILLVIVIGFEQIVIQQFLMASSSNKSIMIVGLIGVLVGISLNILVTPSKGAIGSALSWGVSEFCVLILGNYLVKKVLKIAFDYRKISKSIIGSFIYFIPYVFPFFMNHWVTMFFSFIYICFSFLFLNLILIKNKYIVYLKDKFLETLNIIK